MTLGEVVRQASDAEAVGGAGSSDSGEHVAWGMGAGSVQRKWHYGHCCQLVVSPLLGIREGGGVPCHESGEEDGDRGYGGEEWVYGQIGEGWHGDGARG